MVLYDTTLCNDSSVITVQYLLKRLGKYNQDWLVILLHILRVLVSLLNRGTFLVFFAFVFTHHSIDWLAYSFNIRKLFTFHSLQLYSHVLDWIIFHQACLSGRQLLTLSDCYRFNFSRFQLRRALLWNWLLICSSTDSILIVCLHNLKSRLGNKWISFLSTTALIIWNFSCITFQLLFLFVASYLQANHQLTFLFGIITTVHHFQHHIVLFSLGIYAQSHCSFCFVWFLCCICNFHIILWRLLQEICVVSWKTFQWLFWFSVLFSEVFCNLLKRSLIMSRQNIKQDQVQHLQAKQDFLKQATCLRSHRSTSRIIFQLLLHWL